MPVVFLSSLYSCLLPCGLMRAERCEATIDRAGNPILVVWHGQEFRIQRVLRTFCSGGTGNLSLREHWIVDADATTLHIYSVEYGAPGFRGEKLWWLAAIDPDPRGFMRLL